MELEMHFLSRDNPDEVDPSPWFSFLWPRSVFLENIHKDQFDRFQYEYNLVLKYYVIKNSTDRVEKYT